MLANVNAAGAPNIGSGRVLHGGIEPVQYGNRPETVIVRVAMVDSPVCSVDQEVDQRMAMDRLTSGAEVGGEQEETNEGQRPEDPKPGWEM